MTEFKAIFGLNKKLLVYLKPFCTHLLQLKTVPGWQRWGHEPLLGPFSALNLSNERFELLPQYPAKIILYAGIGRGTVPRTTRPV